MTNTAPMLETPPPFHHVSVMVEEITNAFAAAQGIVVDATAGGAGHASALLAAHPGISVFAFDRDPRAVEAARHRLLPFGARARVEQAVFSEIPERLAALGVDAIGGVLADLGVSSEQLADAERGMSFRLEGPLDMRMDPTRGETALELIARLSQDELADVIYELGEERASRRIARCIKQALANGELETTLDLRRAVVRAVGPRRVGGVDPATRTFQGLRIAVNRELDQLDALLSTLPLVVRPGGVAAIISFHSLEDRRVKQAFLDPRYERLTKHPIVASAFELDDNPRSRSAKLRAARILPSETSQA